MNAAARSDRLRWLVCFQVARFCISSISSSRTNCSASSSLGRNWTELGISLKARNSCAELARYRTLLTSTPREKDWAFLAPSLLLKDECTPHSSKK
jgi:hypothetical protein